MRAFKLAQRAKKLKTQVNREFSTTADGTALTVTELNQHKKPYFIVYLDEVETSVNTVKDRLQRQNIKILNVAGPRESIVPGTYHKNKCFLDKLFASLL